MHFHRTHRWAERRRVGAVDIIGSIDWKLLDKELPLLFL
jgi:hypothetical protein